MTVNEADAVDSALREVMQPGENVLAATKAMASWLPKWILAAFVVLGSIWGIMVSSLTRLNNVEYALLLYIPITIAYAWLTNYSHNEGPRRPVVYLAVTEQQLICMALKKGGQPGSLMFNAPLLAVQIKCVHRPLPGWSYVRYRGPGVRSQGLRLFPPRNQLDDVTKVLRALQSAGVQVDGQPARG
jgi:hypothetical protein